MRKLAVCLIVCAVAAALGACGAAATPTSAPPPTQPPPTSAPPTSPPVAPTATTAQASPAPTGAASPTSPPSSGATPTPPGLFTYPAPPTTLPTDLPPAQPLGSTVVFAWNNLGMHCYQRDFSQFLILPPYNVLWAQVVVRGREPRIVRGNAVVDYAVPQETNPVPYTDFWDVAPAYGFQLQPGIGLTGKGTSGTMDAGPDYFIAEGVPLVDFTDAGVWDPFPFFVVTVKDNSGNTVAQTVNVAPVSTEMSCYLCHGGATLEASMGGILQSHDRNQGTGLYNQAQSGKPVLCDTCHADPAMGVNTSQGSNLSLSSAMHTFHADKMVGSQMPSNTCYACHPGPQTQCLRGAMAQVGITCTDCHGTMSDVGSPARTSWVNLPQCQSCHTSSLVKATTAHIDNPNQNLTPNEAALFRNSKAHGGTGIYCSACHGSPHAEYPTIDALDNEQSIRLQGRAGVISDCTVCHVQQPGESFFHFGD